MMSMSQALKLRIIGFAASLIFTLAAYFITVSPNLLNLDLKYSIPVILTLALFQATAQFIFFLDVWREKGTFWNLFIFISTILIIFIIVFFSIWIMDHLNTMIP
jgi:heme/copper-type cytochrome/quinol oxidase subunit 4